MLILILVPFFLFEDALTVFGTAIMHANVQKPVLFIFVIALLASDILLPVPSSLVSSVAGHVLGFAAGLGAVWSGMMLGSLLGYWIGAYGGESLVRKIVGDEELARARGYAERYGVYGLVLGRAVPVLAEAGVVFAGITRMRLGRFVAATALSNFGISCAYSAIGAYSFSVNSFLWTFAAAIIVPAVAMAVARFAFR